MKKLEGKAVVITGGNSGIGLAIAREFARQGAKVAIFGRNASTLSEAERSIDGECLAVQGDVRRVEDLDRLFARVKDRFGQIDSIVANAGGLIIQPFEEVSEDSFDEQCGTLFRGVFFTVQRGLPLLREGGTVVLVSSNANVLGNAGVSVYGAAKAAVRSLARTLTTELAPRGIRVNVLSPGPVETPIYDRMGLPGAEVGAAKEAFRRRVPLGRIGRPEEMATAALFLVCEDSSFIAGVDLAADGGMAQV